MRTCQYCDFTARGSSMSESRTGYFCRSELACFNRILPRMRTAESRNRRMQRVGQLMADTCALVARNFHLHPDDAATLDDLCRQWKATR